MAGCNKLFIIGVVVMLLTSIHAGQMSLEECQKGVARGDAESFYQLGLRYEKGDGVRRNPMKAVSNFRKAADKKHKKACEKMASLYERGTIVARDAAKAAKYRAMSQGESGEVAEAKVRTKEEEKKAEESEIETALDYIVGRNGRPRDVKRGIRMLHQIAQNNTVAQRLFVERWERGELDDGLDALDVNDMELILPWFADQFKKGHKQGGFILANAAYRRGKWQEAIYYWEQSAKAGVYRSWEKLGDFHFFNEENGGGPESMRSEKLAKEEYSKYLRLCPEDRTVKFKFALVCLYGEHGAQDYSKAHAILGELLRSTPNNANILFNYGISGLQLEDEKFLVALAKLYRKDLRRSYDKAFLDWLVKEIREGRSGSNQAVALYRTYCNNKLQYIEYIRKAANLGDEMAKEFMKGCNQQ